MHPVARLRWKSFGQGLKHDLIQQTAFFVLVFRVLEGLAAWLLFNELFLPAAPDVWPLHLVFVAYFLINSALCLRYRYGQITNLMVFLDVAINLGTVTLVARYTGGLASPLVLISLFKVAAYALVFSPQAGTLAAVLALGGLGGLGLGEVLGWWDMVILDQTLERRIEFVFRVSVLGMILVAATWMFNQVADKDRRLLLEARRAKDAADRERAEAAVTGALLAVSEAVSRPTSLEEILYKVVDIAPRVLHVDYCGIFLWNEDTGTYRGAAAGGIPADLADHLTKMQLTPDQVPDLEWVRQLGHCAMIPSRGPTRLGVPETPTLLTAPLLSLGQFYGVVQFARRGGNSFVQRDLTIADGIARQTAVAIERARLLEASRRLVRAVESTQEAVLITDRHRRVVFANQAFLQVFGYTWEEVKGLDSLTLAGGMDPEWLRDVERSVVEQSWRGEAVARRKDGATFPAALHVNLIRTQDNQIEGVVAIVEDISAQKHLQEQLQRTERLAAAGELAAGVAHEVNNALTSILGQAESARVSADVDSLHAAMECVETQGRRIADIVQGLLGFARPQPPERGPIDLRALVRETLALMAHDLGRNRVRSETRFAPELPPVLADAKQIQQVLVNLFTNAMQAMEPRGGGVLAVSIAPAAGVVRLEVQDHGTGIDPEVLPRVFDPFFSTKAMGTGLGLSVSYAIVRAHGGDMTVRSTLNEGTTFTLKLPAVADTPAERPRSVLLIDDDPAVADTLAAMLAREGLTVQRAASGEEGLAILRGESFDAIFLDVRLPDIPGPEVYARLAAERPELAQRVVFVTGGLWRIGGRGLREKLPAQPTLSKPCTAAQIHEVLRLLRDARAAA